MNRRNFGRLLAAGTLLFSTIPAVMPVPAMAQAGKTIVGGFDVGPGGFQGNFNPLTATAGFTWLNTYFEPLVIYTSDLSKLTGALASEFAVGQDNLTYTFKLVDTKWHDGKPFTSADVKFTLELARNAESGSIFAARLAGIASVETPDERTAVVKLSKPNSAFLSVLSQVMILPQHALSSMPVKEVAKSQWWSTQPVGTGPFKFVKYVSDQYVEMAAYEGYRGGKPKADRLINRYFANPAAAVAALRAGEVQFTFAEPDDAKTFKGNDSFRVIEGDSYVVNYIGFNHRAKIWDDLRVRQAVMYAIDRNAIVSSLFGGAAKLANCGYVAPQLLPKDLTGYAHDPQKAKDLLAEAGWDKINGDKPIPWLTYYNTPQVANVMAAIQAMLAQVGINVVPRALDVPSYNGIVRSEKWQDFPMIYAGLQNGPNPASLNIGLNAAQIPPSGNNIMRVEMPALTEALNTAMAETDPAKADAKWQQVCKEMNSQLPWGPMWVASRYGVVSSKLKDFFWTPAPAGGPFVSHPEKWDIAP
ncbi:peptide/nickel transport system substrate-binding protein [Rhizobium petrolearium]|uniref:ABC transporter substrate-binding protein n=1 Tax=Neorhizobium petrolearium TaxID=515361 RepID=UPI001FDBFE03|nr:peptide/nickel transport system substrate-binding protein [Neorhizobium petrolearium]